VVGSAPLELGEIKPCQTGAEPDERQQRYKVCRGNAIRMLDLDRK